jgi:hypothetical protein
MYNNQNEKFFGLEMAEERTREREREREFLRKNAQSLGDLASEPMSNSLTCIIRDPGGNWNLR